jgi:hypothetical protein
MDANCPKCGSQNVCQDYIDLRPVRTYGWVCDACGHTWDVEIVTDPDKD